MADPYQDREQTKAKHFILKGYLQLLAFKILRWSDLTYVDGFSGPWQTRTEDFADSSFMIAIAALKDAQQKVFEQTGTRRTVRCFFSERDTAAFKKLEEAVIRHHSPDDHFHIKTFHGEFENAVGEIRSFVGDSFALIFIDPTGWAGYALRKIDPLFAQRKCEVLINYMDSFASRFLETEEPGIIASFDPILGGPGWRDRLDQSLPRGEAALTLFRQNLKDVGRFEFVVSTPVDKPTEDRPHFQIVYATKAFDGLKAYRDIEHQALRVHAANRANAKGRKREAKSGTQDMFAAHEAEQQELSIDERVELEKRRASDALIDMLRHSGPLTFANVAKTLMQPYMLRETNVKDLVVDLARGGIIRNSWGGGNRKPHENDIVELAPV